ncbi:MAG: F0F1 ATP synthase subunit beta, partial [Vulcanimicrobiota bacterium]
MDRRISPPEEWPNGVIEAVRGSVVDVRFERSLPPIHTLLKTGSEYQVSVEVLGQLDARVVRGIALNPTQGLVRGQSVRNTGQQLQVPVGKGILGRMFNVFGEPIDDGEELQEVEMRPVHNLPPPL